jgi:hypothetical protein
VRFPQGCDTSEKRAAACYRAAERLRLLYNGANDDAERRAVLEKQKVVLSLANQYAKHAGKFKGNATDAEKRAFTAFKRNAQQAGPLINLDSIDPIADFAETRKNISGGEEIAERD